MLNKNLKEKFISTLESDIDVRFFKNRFEEFSGLEDELGLDICQFSKQQILDFFEKENILYLTLTNRLYLFSRYSDWCLKELGLDPQDNVFKHIKPLNDLKPISKNYNLVDRDSLIRELVKFPNPSDRFFVLAVFEGLTGVGLSDEAVKLKINNFDIKNNTVTLTNGNTFKVSRQLIEWAILSNATLVSQSPQGKIFQLKENGRIIKDKFRFEDNSDDDKREKNAYRSFNRWKKFTGLEEVNIRNIYDSGMIDYLLSEFEKQDKYPTISKYLYREGNFDKLRARYPHVAQNLNHFLKKYLLIIDK